jgi:hypothetical protein
MRGLPAHIAGYRRLTLAAQASAVHRDGPLHGRVNAAEVWITTRLAEREAEALPGVRAAGTP